MDAIVREVMERGSDEGVLGGTHTRDQRGTRGDHLAINDMKGEIEAIETTLNLTRRADLASLTSIQSKSYADGRSIIMAVDASLEHLRDLEAISQTLMAELDRRRLQIIAGIQPGSLNTASSLPILRLPTEILYRVADLLALSTPATPNHLGWMKISHVCTAWRQAIISFAALWAREVGVFASPESFQIISQRAGDAPLTVTNPSLSPRQSPFGQPRHVRLHGLYFEILPRVRTLGLTLESEDMEHLIRALSRQNLPLMETIALENVAGISFSTMVEPRRASTAALNNLIVCPNLRSLSLRGVFATFSSTRLTSIILCGTRRHPLSITGSQFLDMLSQSAETLEEICLLNWLPTIWEVPRERRVQLPGLRKLSLLSPSSEVAYPKLCKLLQTPALAMMNLETSHEPHTMSDVLGVLDWVCTNGQACPCNKDAIQLAVYHEENGITQKIAVHMDSHDFNPNRMLSRGSDTQSGVDLVFPLVVNDTHAPIDSEDLLRVVISRYASWRVRSSLRPLEILGLRSGHLLSMDARDLLRDLNAVKTLHLCLAMRSYTHQSMEDQDNSTRGVLGALAMPELDGSFLLPLLQAVAYRVDAPFFGLTLAGRAEVQEQLESLALSRASHGTPISVRDMQST
ncbi:unnamed protein product [Peniophora sp. CBMAI 1063]|nr:unnamed protein product [Peniophora sp. CBMAI 1063]